MREYVIIGFEQRVERKEGIVPPDILPVPGISYQGRGSSPEPLDLHLSHADSFRDRHFHYSAALFPSDLYP
jgi:hypothetical protein